MTINFTVAGIAQPAGSKKSYGKGGRSIVDANKNSRPWKNAVSAEAAKAMEVAVSKAVNLRRYRPPLEGPLELQVIFWLPRPKGHYGAKGLRPSAPPYPAVRPDTTKLLRAVEDAMTGIIWRDDAQVVHQTAGKRYGEPARTEIQVRELRPGAIRTSAQGSDVVWSA